MHQAVVARKAASHQPQLLAVEAAAHPLVNQAVAMRQMASQAAAPCRAPTARFPEAAHRVVAARAARPPDQGTPIGHYAAAAPRLSTPPLRSGEQQW